MNEIFSMTNSTRKIELEGKDYILRIPGKGTDKLIDRTKEYEIYKIIAKYNISDEVLYFDKNTGIKITKFISDTHNCNSRNIKDVKKAVEIIRHLHDLDLKVDFSFDLKERINFYESLMKKSRYSDYDEVHTKIFELLTMIEKQDVHYCLCHIDPNQDNCLINNDYKKTTLVDWEYAAMQDPLIDIAMFAIYAGYTKDEIDNLFNLYTTGKYSKEELFRYYSYIAASGLLWSNWCEFKNQLGQFFGGIYEQSQYNYAKEYSKLAKEIL